MDVTPTSQVPTPNSNTPPSSPTPVDLSARSAGSCSGNSSRSGKQTRMSSSVMGSLPPSGMHENARSVRSGSDTGRNSSYATPASSARVSEFGSVYESMSHCGSARTMYDTVSYCGSARTADLSSVYENDSNRTIPRAGVQEVPEGGSKKGSRKKQNAYAAAFDSFAPPARADNSSPSASRQHEAAEVS